MVTSRCAAPEKEKRWPLLAAEGYLVASPPSFEYNCVAFAADVEDEWWWPDPNGDAAWPETVKREERLDCFTEAYGTLGYEPCADGTIEASFEKIVIYASGGIPAHVAKQLPDGRWKSKLGAWEDIEHETVHALEDSSYGKAVLYLKRRAP